MLCVYSSECYKGRSLFDVFLQAQSACGFSAFVERSLDSMLSFLDRERSIAKSGYSRWLVPPAALAIHLAIGQVYAFSVFKNPLLALHGADGSQWNLKEIGYIFSIA